MMKKKICALISLGILIALATSLYLSSEKNPEKMNFALKALLQENFYSAQELINELESKSNAYEMMLYRGYLSQAMGNYQEADQILLTALSSIRIPARGQEILQAIALNKFLKNKFEDLADVMGDKIGSPISYPQNSKHSTFFKGVLAYSEGRFKEARAHFEAYSLLKGSIEKNCWFDHIIEKNLPDTWFQTHIAFCHYEENNLPAAIEILDNLQENGKATDLATQLLALCHLRASHSLTDEKRESSCKLALFYFEKMGAKKHVSPDEVRLALHLQNEISLAIKTKHFDKWALSFIAVLEKWGVEKALGEIAVALTQSQFKEESQDLEIAYKLVRKTQTPLFFACLNEQVNQSFCAQIGSNTTHNLIHLWETFENTAFANPKAKSKIANLLEEKILAVILKDTTSLEHTNDMLHLWKKIINPRGSKSGSHSSTLAQKLIHQGKLMWLKEGEEHKGTQLMELSFTFMNRKESKEHLKDLEVFFKNLYAAAEGANMVARLKSIHDATQQLKIDSLSLCPKGAIANYVADANYLFSSRNYSSAKTNAELVLKVDPTNQTALQLVGLSCYHLGEYAQALVSLNQLESLDENAQKALVLCQAAGVSKEEKQLVQVDTLDELEADE